MIRRSFEVRCTIPEQNETPAPMSIRDRGLFKTRFLYSRKYAAQVIV